MVWDRESEQRGNLAFGGVHLARIGREAEALVAGEEPAVAESRNGPRGSRLAGQQPG